MHIIAIKYVVIFESFNVIQLFNRTLSSTDEFVKVKLIRCQINFAIIKCHVAIDSTWWHIWSKYFIYSANYSELAERASYISIYRSQPTVACPVFMLLQPLNFENKKNNFIPHIMCVIIYPCWNFKLICVSKVIIWSPDRLIFIMEILTNLKDGL